jgi:hypothetical protein
MNPFDFDREFKSRTDSFERNSSIVLKIIGGIFFLIFLSSLLIGGGWLLLGFKIFEHLAK